MSLRKIWTWRNRIFLSDLVEERVEVGEEPVSVLHCGSGRPPKDLAPGTGVLKQRYHIFVQPVIFSLLYLLSPGPLRCTGCACARMCRMPPAGANACTAPPWWAPGESGRRSRICLHCIWRRTHENEPYASLWCCLFSASPAPTCGIPNLLNCSAPMTEWKRSCQVE